jgi:hypothetical protein
VWYSFQMFQISSKFLERSMIRSNMETLMRWRCIQIHARTHTTEKSRCVTEVRKPPLLFQASKDTWWSYTMEDLHLGESLNVDIRKSWPS